MGLGAASFWIHDGGGELVKVTMIELFPIDSLRVNHLDTSPPGTAVNRIYYGLQSLPTHALLAPWWSTLLLESK